MTDRPRWRLNKSKMNISGDLVFLESCGEIDIYQDTGDGMYALVIDPHSTPNKWHYTWASTSTGRVELHDNDVEATPAVLCRLYKLMREA